MDSILQCLHVTKSYGAAPALQDVSFLIPPGQIVGLLGPNGSGKTTLIKLICGLLTTADGSISICGNPPGTEAKKHIAYLPDHSSLDPGLTIRGAVQFFHTFFSDFDKQKALEMLSALSLPQKKRLHCLSKGDLEKVQLVLTMSRHARLYILDEPLGAVDPATRDYILHTIISNYTEDSSLLLSTHLIADVENTLDRAIFIKEGRIVLDEMTDHIRETENKSIDSLFREVFKCYIN